MMISQMMVSNDGITDDGIANDITYDDITDNDITVYIYHCSIKKWLFAAEFSTCVTFQ